MNTERLCVADARFVDERPGATVVLPGRSRVDRPKTTTVVLPNGGYPGRVAERPLVRARLDETVILPARFDETVILPADGLVFHAEPPLPVVEPTTISRARSPRTALMAAVSDRSLWGVEVPWALT